jgi:hypothetical protein
MPLRGSFSSGGGGGVSSATASALILEHGPLILAEDCESEKDLINRGTASSPGPTVMQEPHVFRMVFDAGWPSDIIPSINGTDRNGDAISEAFAPPGGGAGGTVNGSKVFCTWTTTTISGASAGAHNVSVQYRSVIPVPTAPVTAFAHVWHATVKITPPSVDLTNGWVATSSAIFGADSAHIIYTHTPTIVLT